MTDGYRRLSRCFETSDEDAKTQRLTHYAPVLQIGLLSVWNGNRVDDLLGAFDAVQAKCPPKDAIPLVNSELAACPRRCWRCGPRFAGIKDGSPQLSHARHAGLGEFTKGIRSARWPSTAGLDRSCAYALQNPAGPFSIQCTPNWSVSLPYSLPQGRTASGVVTRPLAKFAEQVGRLLLAVTSYATVSSVLEGCMCIYPEPPDSLPKPGRTRLPVPPHLALLGHTAGR